MMTATPTAGCRTKARRRCLQLRGNWSGRNRAAARHPTSGSRQPRR
uniref:Uncharacterized protein n=1 Tax=Macrostomum lignano TaxID=282301 RepID=A0A1I8FJA4_9PLAT